MRKFVKYIIIISFVFIIAGMAILGIFGNAIFGINSDVKFDKNMLIQLNSKISLYDKNNKFIDAVSRSHPIARLDDLPDYIPDAFISIEDKDFYKHNGLNYKRIAKALFTNLTSGHAKEGASTISQQLIKNSHLTSEKTLDRKIKEILLTLKLEREFKKDDILETYLNIIYFGSSNYGIESASKNYFNKSAEELTIAEAATLAGIIKAPLTYSPVYNIENCKARRDLILREMLKDKKITKSEFNEAVNTELVITSSIQAANAKSIYEKASIEEASKILNLSEKDVAISGLKVFTYMDKDIQHETEKLILNEAYYHKNNNGYTADSGVVVIDNETGGINAFYGNSDYNLVTMKRSPGSAIKPILVYAPALELGKISPSTPILDEKINIRGYTPHNVNGKFSGWITARNSIEKSLNIPAIKIMQYVGIDKAKEFAKNAGITFNKKDMGYSLALGGFTDGITIIELTNSYVPFANKGNYVKASFIRKIEDSNGKILYERNPEYNKIMSEETAYLMTDMLIASAKHGTSQKLKTLKFEVAGKTGTVGIPNTNNNSDAWSVAYTPTKSIGVWLGNSTGDKEMQLDPSNNGGTYATMLARDIINKANKTKNDSFYIPEGIVKEKIDIIELKDNQRILLANDETPEMYTINEVFNKKYAPKGRSKSFKVVNPPNLSVKVENNISKITFMANNYLTYEIYRIQEDQTKLIDTIKNKSGIITILDEDLEEEVIYSYYIIAKQINHVTGKEIVSRKGKPVKAVLNNKKFDISKYIEDIKMKANKHKKRKRRFIFWG